MDNQSQGAFCDENHAFPTMPRIAVNALNGSIGDLNIPRHLRDYGITEADIPNLAAGAMKVTRLLANNPRLITLADAIEIYTQAL
jgi:alcohol dehydrogenase class IV